MEEVSLVIEDIVFKVRKQILCEHSDYFRAMFSGNYVENEKKEIKIDVIDAASMKIIKQYMDNDLIDLTDLSLAIMNDLAMAANFLQITELIKQIEYTLDYQLSASNWIETLAIAESASYSKLQKLAVAFGLFSFNYMKPEHIPTIQRLFWYLSHPYLNARTELDVFNFGLQWILQRETGIDALMIILGCLDVHRVTKIELEKMQFAVKEYVYSLAARVIDCMLELVRTDENISVSVMRQSWLSLWEQFTERVCTETINLVQESRQRKLKFVPVVPIWMLKNKKPQGPHNLFTFSLEKGLEKWLEVADRNLWGWSIVSWGPTRIVVVGGEMGRGSGIFMKDVRVYDVLKKEWTHHGVQLPPRRHFGVAVVRDSLFIVGGVGGFRVVLETALIYDLKQRTHRKIASLPDAIQNPAVCSHREIVYASGHNNIYRYEDSGDKDQWVKVASTKVRMSCMVSFKEYVYCSQYFFTFLYRFRPDIDQKLENITGLSNPPVSLCDLGNRMLIFTKTMCENQGMISVEEYIGRDVKEKPKVIWAQSDDTKQVYDVAGSCSIVTDAPPIDTQVSMYHQRYLSRYIQND